MDIGYIVLVVILFFILQAEISVLGSKIMDVDSSSPKWSDLAEFAERLKMLSLKIREIENKK